MNVRRPGPPIIPSLAAYIKLPRINGNAECIAPITSSNSRSNISSLARAEGTSQGNAALSSEARSRKFRATCLGTWLCTVLRSDEENSTKKTINREILQRDPGSRNYPILGNTGNLKNFDLEGLKDLYLELNERR